MTAERDFDLSLPDGNGIDTSLARESETGAVSWQEKLPGLLRILGTGVLLVTMYSFLVDGWRSGNDSLRYLMMLGHTGALALIGIAALHWLNEAKGARLLLSLALVAVPANFAILGALVFSCTAGVGPSTYPDYVAWRAVSPFGVTVLTLGAVLLLTPLTLFGFRVLARSMATRLTGLFLANNALLLLPFRESDLLPWGVAAVLLATVCFNRRIARGNHAARTPEGILALMLPYLPLAILMVRSLWLYTLDFVLVAATCLGVYLLLRQLIDWLGARHDLRTLLEVFSVFPALVIAVPVGVLLTDADWPGELVLPLAGFVSAALLYDLAARSTAPAFYRWLAAVLLTSSQGAGVLIFSTLLAAAVTCLSGLVLMVLALYYRQRGLLLAGACLMAAAVIHQLGSLVLAFELASWVGMAALGILAIVIASVLESRGSRLAEWIHHRWRELSAWEI